MKKALLILALTTTTLSAHAMQSYESTQDGGSYSSNKPVRVYDQHGRETQPDDVRKSFENFIKNYGDALKVETPWEEFITSLPILARNKAIIFNKDYKYAYDRQERVANNRYEIIETPYLLCIHFEQAYKAFSAYYRQVKKNFPPTQKELLLYAKNDLRIHQGRDQITKGINIGGIKRRCLIIDIQKNYDLSVLDKM